MKPRFVKEVTYRGDVVDRFKPEVLNSRLCSESTIKDLHSMLCGVVDSGTATNLSNRHFSIAGKTGTAQIPDPETGYKVKSRISYQASFVGYFPADNPKYSCIVVVNSPSNNIYYGNIVAGPVFWEIANKVFATTLDMHLPLNMPEKQQMAEAPFSKSGNFKDLSYTLKNLGFKLEEKGNHAEWISVRSSGEMVQISPRAIIPKLVPNVLDMGLKDAIYLMESNGIEVRVNGRGTVRSQSVLPGSRIDNNMVINLEMSIKDS
jgi:cell division protein FtsI (penicillin-binding protein 3)